MRCERFVSNWLRRNRHGEVDPPRARNVPRNDVNAGTAGSPATKAQVTIVLPCVQHGARLLNQRHRRRKRTHADESSKAVFPAAGLGTRFLPATKAQPKEMLPLVDKPIIQYGVEEAWRPAATRSSSSLGAASRRSKTISTSATNSRRCSRSASKTDLLKIVREISDMMHVAYVRQKEALGLGHAVLMARELVGNEPFAVLLADDVIDAEALLSSR